MIELVIERWHAYLRGELPGGIGELLDDDVVFYSPVVFAPQRGRAVTARYLEAAATALPGDPDPDGRPGITPTGGFRYTREVVAGDTAVLEFETTIEGTFVNGVDIIRCDEAGRIVEFRVMVRPRRAVNLVHRLMAATLGAMPAE
jgi:hypothetical protein